MVRQTPNSFGYVELIYASRTRCPLAQCGMHPASSLKASTAGVTAAAAAAAKTMPADYRISITNAAGPDSYPISSFHLAVDPYPRWRCFQDKGFGWVPQSGCSITASTEAVL